MKTLKDLKPNDKVRFRRGGEAVVKRARKIGVSGIEVEFTGPDAGIYFYNGKSALYQDEHNDITHIDTGNGWEEVG